MNAGPATIKALKIIKEFPSISNSGFAQKMWPDSNMHTKVSNQGHGACSGKAAWLCGGSFLKKLVKHGYLKHSFFPNGYKLTEKAEELI